MFNTIMLRLRSHDIVFIVHVNMQFKPNLSLEVEFYSYRYFYMGASNAMNLSSFIFS